MTSFTRKLYARDPRAAEHFARQQRLDRTLSYGKHVTLACFTMPQFESAFTATVKPFGQRASGGKVACETLCSHPACKSGCTLQKSR